MKFRLLALATTIAVSLSSQARAELVTNGDFETGSSSGWSFTHDQFGNSGVDGTTPKNGSYGAFFGDPTTEAAAVLSQTISTVAGQTYTVSFWLKSDDGDVGPTDPDNSFKLTLGSSTILSLKDIPIGDYTFYSFNVTAAENNALLAFSVNNTPNYLDLDVVSVNVATGAVPEPSTWAMIIIGFAAIGFMTHRRKSVTGARYSRQVRA